ncbi:hypothetical protein K488DRAFT_84683 [Vararia minispora EC-137]|uniref:Uncharacterized protein n=1 Tax=Vararia minispora EC-137 TaxID=1314806 RepID=A0ACB8QPM7_9AGAM|nr:hypothetical protein K488DRAFT_84683 [Vararia minispora EC-137]
MAISADDHLLAALVRSHSTNADQVSAQDAYLSAPRSAGHTPSLGKAHSLNRDFSQGSTFPPWDIPSPSPLQRDFLPPTASVRRPGSDPQRIWKIYLEHVEKPDNVLVETWKEDMNGVLIFAGLFSQVVTAFLIDSYGKVQDPTQRKTVLVVIIVCWFLSLVLLLLAALSATLVQQWARTYLENPKRAEDAVHQARLRTAAFLGVKTFGVQASVKSIPILLHLALWLFLGGLVAFLFQIYDRLAEITLAFVGAAAGIYFILSILPTIFPDCPYNTPLTTVIWCLEQLYRLAVRRRPKGHEDLAEQKKIALDIQALRWTIASLSDDDDFIEFLSLLPKLVIRPGASSVLIDKLLFGPDMLAENLTRILHSIVPAEAVTEAEREEQEARASICLRTTCLLAAVACKQENIAPDQIPRLAINFYAPAARDVSSLTHHTEPRLARLARHTELMLSYRVLCNLRTHLWDLVETVAILGPYARIGRPHFHFNVGYFRRPLFALLDGSSEPRLHELVEEGTCIVNDLQNLFQPRPGEAAPGSGDSVTAGAQGQEQAQRMLEWCKRCFCVLFLHAQVMLRGEREQTSTAADVLEAIMVPLGWGYIGSVTDVRGLLDGMIQDAGVEINEEERKEIVEKYVMVQRPPDRVPV